MPPAVPVAGAVLTMATSATAPAEVPNVALLFAGSGSGVAEVADAVFEMTVPLALEEVLTTKVKTTVPPETSEGALQTIEPVPPTAGVMQVKAGPDAGPLVGAADTKVVFAGMGSLRETVAASVGPLFVRVTL